MARRLTFATFRLDDPSLGNQCFGLDILLVREINRQLELTHVPQAPATVRGLVNLRGQLVTVLDLKRFLGLQPSAITPNSHNIILKTEAELTGVRLREERPDLHGPVDKVGLLVDAIEDVISLTEEDIAPPPPNLGRLDGRFLSGVVTLQDRLVALLTVEEVFQATPESLQEGGALLARVG
jgi:purine-binding chemotaxis protein CheW